MMLTMKRLFTFCLFSLLLVAVNAQKGKKALRCSANNISRQKCRPGKSGRWCIPRVKGVTYNQANVKPTNFLVTWNKVAVAKCYYLEILTDHTSFVFKTFSCVKGTQFRVTGLKPWTLYGVRVSAVNRICKRGQPSNPTLKIKTYWSPAFTVSKPTARPTYSPKVGACGRNFFTCKSNHKECIPKGKYCNKVLDCADGTDEKDCPGSCREINVEFKNGNYSCSRWSSPGSICFFDCDEGYTRDGSRYTQCDRHARLWTNPLPTCRLDSTRIRLVLDETVGTNITVEWESVENAAQYAIQAVGQNADVEGEDSAINKEVNSTACCKTEIKGLVPRLEYRITMYAVDADGTRGMESLPVFYRSDSTKVTVKTSG